MMVINIVGTRMKCLSDQLPLINLNYSFVQVSVEVHLVRVLFRFWFGWYQSCCFHFVPIAQLLPWLRVFCVGHLLMNNRIFIIQEKNYSVYNLLDPFLANYVLFVFQISCFYRPLLFSSVFKFLGNDQFLPFISTRKTIQRSAVSFGTSPDLHQCEMSLVCVFNKIR